MKSFHQAKKGSLGKGSCRSKHIKSLPCAKGGAGKAGGGIVLYKTADLKII